MDGSYAIGFLRLNMGLEAKGATYDMELKKLDFKTKARDVKEKEKLCHK